MTIGADSLSKVVDAAGDYCRDPALLAQLRAVAGRLRVLGDREHDRLTHTRSHRAA